MFVRLIWPKLDMDDHTVFKVWSSEVSLLSKVTLRSLTVSFGKSSFPSKCSWKRYPYEFVSWKGTERIGRGGRRPRFAILLSFRRIWAGFPFSGGREGAHD